MEINVADQINMSDSVVYSEQTFRALLKKLVERPECFTNDDLKAALDHLFIPNVLHPAQIGALLSVLHVNHLERRPGSLAVAASVLRDRALRAAVQEADNDFVVDIVGTGGDGYNLFNVSTTASVVAAGAGARVIKVCEPVLLILSCILISPILTVAWRPGFHIFLGFSRPLGGPGLPLHCPNSRA